MAKAITLITGASSGICRELAFVFAAKKNDLLLVARSEVALKQIAAELTQKYGIAAFYFPCDLR